MLFQPHLYSRTRHLARELARGARRAPTSSRSTDVYPAREEPVEGVSGKLVVDALADLRPGMPVAWTPSVEDGARFLAGARTAGDRVVTIGAGDVDRAVALLLEALAMKIEEGVRLSRFTTLGTGGPARAFARPETVEELEGALDFARAAGLELAAIGLGSNLLVADEGFEGLVLKLGGELAAVDVRGRAARRGRRRAECGRPAPRPRRRPRRLRVRLRDPGDGRRRRLDERGRLRRRLGGHSRARARRRRRRAPTGRRRKSSGCATATPSCGTGQVVAAVEFRLVAAPPSEIKAMVADLQAQRKAAQPTNKRTYGSVFKNPDHELSAGRMLEACGLKGHRIGGAQISPRHANFIENADGARSADAIALMVEARRRAWEQFGVELRARGRVPRRARAAADRRGRTRGP